MTSGVCVLRQRRRGSDCQLLFSRGHGTRKLTRVNTIASQQAEDQSNVANVLDGSLSSHQLNELLCKVVMVETEVALESMEK